MYFISLILIKILTHIPSPNLTPTLVQHSAVRKEV